MEVEKDVLAALMNWEDSLENVIESHSVGDPDEFSFAARERIHFGVAIHVCAKSEEHFNTMLRLFKESPELASEETSIKAFVSIVERAMKFSSDTPEVATSKRLN